MIQQYFVHKLRFIFFKILRIENLNFWVFENFQNQTIFWFLFFGNFQRTSGFHEIICKEIGGLGVGSLTQSFGLFHWTWVKGPKPHSMIFENSWWRVRTGYIDVWNLLVKVIIHIPCPYMLVRGSKLAKLSEIFHPLWQTFPNPFP